MANRLRSRRAKAARRASALRAREDVQARHGRYGLPIVRHDGEIPAVVQRQPPGSGSDMTARPDFGQQVREVACAMKEEGVVYLLIGKDAAIIHGFPDTTQDTDIFVLKSAQEHEGARPRSAQARLQLTDAQEKEIHAGKDFAQLRNGPFDLDLVFTPDGIESFEEAWRAGRNIEGYPVCSLDDIIESKRSANRTKDRESLARLEDFRRYLDIEGRRPGAPLPPLRTTTEGAM